MTSLDTVATSDGAPEYRVVDADGIATRYLDYGSGEPLLLLHGSGPGVTAWSNWSHTIPAFEGRRRVLAPEYVGFGGTQRRDDIVYGVAAWAKHVLDFLDALGIEEVDIVGNSMGGAIALRIARDHPDRVGKLVLMGSGGLEPRGPSAGLAELRAYEPSFENMHALIANTFLYESTRVTDELVQDRLESSMAPGVHETYRKMFHDQAHRGNEHWLPESEIRRVKAPALVVHGREDRVIEPETAWRLAHLLPHAWLFLVPHCGHWAQIEHATSFNRVVAGFLAETPSEEGWV